MDSTSSKENDSSRQLTNELLLQLLLFPENVTMSTLPTDSQACSSHKDQGPKGCRGSSRRKGKEEEVVQGKG